jgi:hypothetical protein
LARVFSTAPITLVTSGFATRVTVTQRHRTVIGHGPDIPANWGITRQDRRVETLTVPKTGSLWPRLVEFAVHTEHASALEDAGLGLVPLETVHLFQATPVNSVTFASTGASGVHFGFVPGPDQPLDRSPVVMTVPLADDPNHIVGGSLAEFLSLGCRQGWSFLDQLAYDAPWAANWYSSRTPPMFPVLETMVRLFGLTPWPDVSGRLLGLRGEYYDRLVFRKTALAADR